MADFVKEPALFVGDIDIDEMDLTKPPSSGEEYIKRVVIEAKQCDDIVVAKIDKTKLKRPTIDARPLAGRVQAPASIIPTLEWQNCQISDFSDVRLRITRLKFEREKDLEWKNTLPNLPIEEDQLGWLNYCLGNTDQEIKSHPPSLDVVLSMNQPLVEQVLEYLVETVEKQAIIGSELGQWLYALLVALELPLTPGVCSCLRTLARACSKARANATTNEDQSVSTMNLFICLVARYFRQLDLADP